jgi:hypothetical protein
MQSLTSWTDNGLAKKEEEDVTTDSVQENNIVIENVRSISSLEGKNVISYQFQII